MNIYSLIAAVNAPNDLWNSLISLLQGGIGNIGWAILVLTLLVKLVTSPLDFMVKYTTKKQMLMQQKLAPQIAKLQKKFGSDQQTLRIQTNALYKREGFNVGSGCLIMLINLVLTCTIFFSFYGSLRTISAYQAINQYELTYEAYEKSFATYVQEQNPDNITDFSYEAALDLSKQYDEAMEYIQKEENSSQPDFAEKTNFVAKYREVMEDATDYASPIALEVWNNNKSSWLWIQNIWVADAPQNTFPTYEELKSSAANAGGYYNDYVANNVNQKQYTAISNLINSKTNTQNGYYILAILAGVITYLSTMISELHNKLKNKKASALADKANTQQAGSMKMMKIIMPIIMIMFVLSSSASFGIYLLASNIAGIALGEIINLLVNKLTKKKRIEVEEYLEKEADRLIRKGKLQG